MKKQDLHLSALIVLELIETHTSDNTISSKAISDATGFKGIEIRQIINFLRMNGFPICSNRTGYYYSEDKAEIQKTIKSLQGRVKAIEQATKGLQSFINSINV